MLRELQESNGRYTDLQNRFLIDLNRTDIELFFPSGLYFDMESSLSFLKEVETGLCFKVITRTVSAPPLLILIWKTTKLRLNVQASRLGLAAGLINAKVEQCRELLVARLQEKRKKEEGDYIFIPRKLFK